MPGNLVRHLISVKNQSGAVKAAIVGLPDLKRAIEEIPTDVARRGVQEILEVSKVAEGLVGMIREFESLAALGDFKNVLGRLSAELGKADLRTVDEGVLRDAIARSIPLDELRSAVGRANALVAGLGGGRR